MDLPIHLIHITKSKSGYHKGMLCMHMPSGSAQIAQVCCILSTFHLYTMRLKDVARVLTKLKCRGNLFEPLWFIFVYIVCPVPCQPAKFASWKLA